MPKVKASLSNNKRMEEMQKLANPEEEPESPSDSRKISDLKNLILLGKLTEKVNIGGFLFTISTLSAQENANVIRALMKAEEMDRVLLSKAIAISFAVKEINSVPLSDLSAEHDGEEEAQRNLAFILDMQATLVEKIFVEYEKLVEKSGEEVGFDIVKK